MEELQGVGTYAEFKQQLDTELSNQAESFVRTGYLLKIARDTEILAESGYSTVTEFAKAEYGFEKDYVSRYIAINDRYSENGYSEQIQDKYKGFGFAKLSEMLTLPDAIIESMSPLMTRREIQEVKKEVKEEEKITEIEVILEGQKEEQKILSNNLQKHLNQYMYDWRERYKEIFEYIKGQDRTHDKDIENILDVIAPSGVAMIAARIRGIGSLMLSVKGKDNDLNLINTRGCTTETYTWKKLIDILETMCTGNTAVESWESIYGEEYKVEKKIDEVAPVQQNEKSKEETVQQNKVVESKNEEKLDEPKNNQEEPRQVEIAEEQIPGQAYIEDYKEVLPEKTVEAQDEPIEEELGDNNEVEEDKHTVVVVKEEIREEEGCRFCNGEEVIASHDGDFTLKVTDRGYISVKFDNGEHQESAIFELKRCPECGKLLREE